LPSNNSFVQIRIYTGTGSDANLYFLGYISRVATVPGNTNKPTNASDYKETASVVVAASTYSYAFSLTDSKITVPNQTQLNVVVEYGYNQTFLTTMLNTTYTVGTPAEAEGALSAGAIAGIVIGSLAGISLLGGGAYYLLKNKKKS
jgi:hypothetical protein